MHAHRTILRRPQKMNTPNSMIIWRRETKTDQATNTKHNAIKTLILYSTPPMEEWCFMRYEQTWFMHYLRCNGHEYCITDYGVAWRRQAASIYWTVRCAISNCHSQLIRIKIMLLSCSVRLLRRMTRWRLNRCAGRMRFFLFHSFIAHISCFYRRIFIGVRNSVGYNGISALGMHPLGRLVKVTVIVQNWHRSGSLSQ